MLYAPSLMASCTPSDKSALAEAANEQRTTDNNEGSPVPVVFGSAFVSGPTVFWTGDEQKLKPGTEGSLPRCSGSLSDCTPTPGPLTGTW